ncbi:PREDICTED: uncharacterized protein LOC109180318 [Ipomoea nil]|uniref:uncharacterized protein LOC109180318 n=1 Tax=Ipomoea nil TaxID=35883 RepID=UPI00090193F9|nr:PREDICTED: uncharacterized protein LOC109180318 [Ipomoea nil]
MSDQEVHLRLCSLIDDSLRPYVEVMPTSFNKENVKELLIALSQVCSQIKRWTVEFASDSDSDGVESDSDTEVTGNSAGVGLVPGSEAESPYSLAKSISVLMGLLAIEYPYVQHLVGNILVAISDFIVASGSSWDEFMQLLSLLKLAAASSFPSSTGCIMVEAKNSCCNSAPSVSPLNPHHKSAKWLTVAVIIQVLRRILKNLKQDGDDHFFKLYLGLTNSFISNMPWDLLDQVFVSQTSKGLEDPIADGLLQVQPAKSKSAIMFLGNFIQLLCSLVEKSIPIEAITDDLDKHPLICEIRNILPRLLDWCLGNLQNSDVYISKYYKHKLLILMIRLSFKIQLDCSVLLSWLHLTHLYFQDLLCLPIAGLESDQDKYLEGSPFCEYIFDAAKENIASMHLHRLAIFLFLRCSFCLVNMEKSGQNCASTDLNSHSDLNLDIERCTQSRGLQELHEWLQRLFNDVFLDHEKSVESIVSFQFSFLRLYMHEDDILFQMLLQLLCVPLCSEKWCVKEGNPSAYDNAYSIVLHLFNPVHLFHIFLAEIHYDHQVLLDYLISKDTGASSAEYLLRCLRMVFKSWSLFTNFLWSGKKEIQLCQKRRKVSLDHLNFKVEVSTPVTDGRCSPVERDQKKGKASGVIDCRTERLPFQHATNCLLELKTSIENLHYKNLFPYNPKVLLQRLSTFQELCQKQ